MAETMLDLWDRWQANFDREALGEFARAVAAVGPIYRRDPDGWRWAVVRPGEPGLALMYHETFRPTDPAVIPPGGGTARDAATVPVPGAKAETWRDREPLFW